MWLRPESKKAAGSAWVIQVGAVNDDFGAFAEVEVWESTMRQFRKVVADDVYTEGLLVIF